MKSLTGWTNPVNYRLYIGIRRPLLWQMSLFSRVYWTQREIITTTGWSWNTIRFTISLSSQSTFKYRWTGDIEAREAAVIRSEKHLYFLWWGGSPPVKGKRKLNGFEINKRWEDAETCLYDEPQNRLFINVFLVCNILYNLLRTHQLLCFCIWDLKTCRKNQD